MRRRLLPYACLAAVYAALAALLRPWTLDGPMNDDWAYLLPARRWAETGLLRLTDWAPATQVLHVAWGALFFKLFGFHIGWLKLPMFAWSAAASLLLFQLLVEEGASEGAALLAAVSLALNPVVLACSMTYMTDVPYLALELASLYALCRGLRGRRDGWLAAGGAAAAAAFLVRQIGLFIPVAAALELRREGRLDIRKAAILLGPALAAAAGYWAWFHFVHGPTVASHFLAERLGAKLAQPLRFAGLELSRVIESTMTLGLFAFPLAVGLARGPASSRRAEWAANGALFAAVWMLAHYGPLPFPTNSFQASGLGWVTVPGEPFKQAGFYAWKGLWLGFSALGLAGAWLLLSRAPEAFRPPQGRFLRVCSWAAVLQLLPSIATFFDRYLLPALPLVLGLPVLAASRRGFSLRTSAAALAVLSCVWLVGAADFADWNRAEGLLLSRAWARGIRPEEIASGWDWDAFYNYERRTAELKSAEPLEKIGEWDWRARADRDLLVTFEPHPETHWSGVELLDRESYSTPLAKEPGTLYLFRLAPAP